VNLLEKKVEFFTSVLPFSNRSTKNKRKRSVCDSLKQKKSSKQFYENILAEYQNKSYRVIGNAYEWESVDPEFFTYYRKSRGRLGIKTRLLLSADSEDVNPMDKRLLREYKYLPEKYKFKSTLNIFKDKVLICQSAYFVAGCCHCGAGDG